MRQVEGAQKLFASLACQGVRDFVLCSGARNAPLVQALAKASGLRVIPFFDERAAAFFALGRIQASGRPVAVVTTSGTAVAELLPATIEAWYSRLPLVLVTADRPPHYRGKGAPQSIEQVGLFSSYVSQVWDFLATELEDVIISGDSPCQVNICFQEPLLDGEIGAWNVEVAEPKAIFSSQRIESTKALEQWCRFSEKSSRPVVVVGRLSEAERPLVSRALQAWQVPVYLEATSGLRESEPLAPWRIEAGEGIFSSTLFSEHFDGLIRLGGVPTTRLWRDLEDRLESWPVLSFSSQGFSGLGREELPPLALVDLESVATESQGSTEETQQWLARQKEFCVPIKEQLQKDPHSEPAIFAQLSQMIPAGSQVFLGNSMPIREWDLAASFEARGLQILANRGANGIDGLISTFLGASKADRENWLILGDLSALYDLNGLWAKEFSEAQVIRLVVINNQGGKIFRRLFNEPLFENQHQLSFEPFADMWKMDYLRWRRVPEPFPQLSDRTVIEIRPNEQASDVFWNNYGNLWKEN